MSSTTTPEPSMATRPASLWVEAISSLREKDKTCIQVKGTIDFDELLQLVKTQQKNSQDKRLKATRSDGEVVIFRDIFSKVATWIQKFVTIGDMLIQYDPGHAALPWAALRFILQACLNDHESRLVLLEGTEEVIRILTWCRIHENLYFFQVYQATDRLKKDLISLYLSIFSFLAKMVRHYTKTPASRMIKSIFPAVEKCRSMLEKIKECQSDVEKTVKIINKETEDSRFEQWQDSQRKLFQELEDLDNSIGRIENISENMHEILMEGENQKMLDWVSNIDYSEHHSEANRKVLEGTGKWLLEHNTFTLWQNSSGCQVLWLHGIPGAGKTCLTSILIQQMMDSFANFGAVCPIYFYCTRNPAEPYRAEPVKIMGCILRQLLNIGTTRTIFDQIKKRFELKIYRPMFSLKEIEDLILQIIEARSATFIFIDALDECSPEQRRELTSSIQRILKSSSGLLKVFISSRENQDIVARLSDYPNLNIQTSDNRDDIYRFVDMEVEARVQDKILFSTLEVSQDLKEEIKKALCRNAQAMFRWVELQLQFLCTLNTVEEMRFRLSSMPPSLSQTYEDIYSREIESLMPYEKELAKSMLSWLLCSGEPLEPSTLRELLASGIEQYRGNPLLTTPQMLKLTANLVVLDQKLDIFRFSHLSVREYLETKYDEYSNELNNERASISSLNTLLQSGNDWVNAYDYASYFWMRHCAKSKSNRFNSRMSSMLLDFMIEDEAAFKHWFRYVQRPLKRERGFIATPGRMKYILEHFSCPLYAACKCGFAEIVKFWISSKREVKPMLVEVGVTPLYIASLQGFGAIVLELLAAGADVNEESGIYGNALIAAACNGHREVVQMLLSKGADPSLKLKTSNFTALQAASINGHKEIVQLLLDAGADVKQTGEAPIQDDPLCAASSRGYIDIVKLLLNAGADVNVEVMALGNPLAAASGSGNGDVVQLLLDSGAQINAKGGKYGSALGAASGNGHIDVVQLLLDNGADINIDGGEYGGALGAASNSGRLVMVQMLLDNGADVNAERGQYGIPLIGACENGHVDVMKLLLDSGADINAKLGAHADGRLDLRGTALITAAFEQREAALRLLLDRGADVNIESSTNLGGDEYSNTALVAAAPYCSPDLVQILLDKGANIHAKGIHWGISEPVYHVPPLIAATETGCTDVVWMLLEHGADINAEGITIGFLDESDPSKGHINTSGDKHYITPLVAAIPFGHVGLVKLLLEKGADINKPAGEYGNAIGEAENSGQEEIVQLLVRHGAIA